MSRRKNVGSVNKYTNSNVGSTMISTKCVNYNTSSSDQNNQNAQSSKVIAKPNIIVDRVNFLDLVFRDKRCVTFNEIDKYHDQDSGRSAGIFNCNRKEFEEGVDYFRLVSHHWMERSIRESGLSAKSCGLNIITQNGYLKIVEKIKDVDSIAKSKYLVENYFNLPIDSVCDSSVESVESIAPVKSELSSGFESSYNNYNKKVNDTVDDINNQNVNNVADHNHKQADQADQVKKSFGISESRMFDDLSIDLYMDKESNNDFWFSSRQIGEALGYSDPQASIGQIYARNINRLQKHTAVIESITSTDGKKYNLRLFNRRGVLEICRYSRQPKADKLYDWVYDIVEAYMDSKLKCSTADAVTTTEIASHNNVDNNSIINNPIVNNSMINNPVQSDITAPLTREELAAYMMYNGQFMDSLTKMVGTFISGQQTVMNSFINNQQNVMENMVHAHNEMMNSIKDVATNTLDKIHSEYHAEYNNTFNTINTTINVFNALADNQKKQNELFSGALDTIKNYTINLQSMNAKLNDLNNSSGNNRNNIIDSDINNHSFNIVDSVKVKADIAEEKMNFDQSWKESAFLRITNIATKKGTLNASTVLNSIYNKIRNSSNYDVKQKCNEYKVKHKINKLSTIDYIASFEFTRNLFDETLTNIENETIDKTANSLKVKKIKSNNSTDHADHDDHVNGVGIETNVNNKDCYISSSQFKNTFDKGRDLAHQRVREIGEERFNRFCVLYGNGIDKEKIAEQMNLKLTTISKYITKYRKLHN